MSNFGSFIYGDGTLYGASLDIGSVSPETGPATGGNQFVLYGEGFTLSAFDDYFTGAILDLALWTDLSSGGGAVTTGSTHLSLSTGASAGAFAMIQGVPVVGSFQAEICATIPRISKYPSAEVTPVGFMYYIDANNYASISIAVGTTSSDVTLNGITVLGGATTDSFSIPWSTGMSTFRILRWQSVVYFIANGEVVYISRNFTSANASFRIFATNGAANYDVSGVTVNYFLSKPYVVFGNSPVWNTVMVSDKRVRGVVPPSIDEFNNEAGYAGLVNVYLVSATVGGITDGYEYYFEKKMVLVDNQQTDLVLSIVDDPIVRTPTDIRRGL